jgi:adenylosuccinate lyase
MTVPNVLATRYASPAMREIWSPENKIVAERRLWIAVLRAQAELGVDFGGDDPTTVLAAYEAVIDQVDLESIAARERVTRHDVKARIEEFNDLAGFEHIHKGMTSRDRGAHRPGRPLPRPGPDRTLAQRRGPNDDAG